MNEETLKEIKILIREKMTVVYVLLGILLLLNVFIIVRGEINNISLRKKVDHRYFNITRSLQDIHKVEIDTYQGRVRN